MMNNKGTSSSSATPTTPLKDQMKGILFPIGNELKNEESKTIDITAHIAIENGEDIIGYQFLHGTNKEVGDFQIQGTISKNEKVDVTYDPKYTCNDKIDSNFQYESDSKKYQLAKRNPGAKCNNYTIRISWDDKTVIKANPGRANKNSGWLSK